eukprot:g32475.t1
MRSNFFTQRVVHVWNELPDEMVDADKVATFKRHLDKYLNRKCLEGYGPNAKPNFISAYDIGLFIYFFFRENAVEHDCGKTVYSRVGRVCKSDVGGRFLLEDTWTTFMKARLNCSRSGEIPFYYNELQSTFYLPEQDLIYGVFTTN